MTLAKVLSTKPDTKRPGWSRVTVELPPGHTLHAIKGDAHYQLAQPLEDVVGGHIISGARAVTWSSAAQEWVS